MRRYLISFQDEYGIDQVHVVVAANSKRWVEYWAKRLLDSKLMEEPALVDRFEVQLIPPQKIDEPTMDRFIREVTEELTDQGGEGGGE